MSAEESIRLLIASEFPPNASGGGPAVVRQMLREWPAGQLGWWSCREDETARFGQQCAQSFCAAIPRKLMPHRRFSRMKSWILGRLWRPLASRHLKKAVAQFQPDAIWAVPHNWAIGPLADALPPSGVGFHVTIQDYVDVHGQPERFGPGICAALARDAERLYAAATTRDATSHPMIEDLKARTGADASQMLHAGVEAEDFAWLQTRAERADDEIRIAYAGTILVEDDFRQWIEAVAAFRSACDRNVILRFFGAHSYAQRRWFDAAWMQEFGNLPEAQLLAALRECDWGLSIMAFEDRDPRYNRFSFPTKFITYLSAGLPVMTIGHPASSVMKMAAQYQVGVVANDVNSPGFSRRLVEELNAGQPWKRFREEILRCARTEFDAARMRKKLYGCFKTCAERTRTGSGLLRMRA
jgi:hypothetical protein